MRPTQSRIFDDTLLAPFRLVGDPTADAVVAAVAQHQGREGLAVFMRFLGDLKDLSLENQPPEVFHFFEQHASLPSWVDIVKLEKGMEFFWRYETEIALLLGCYSLPYCYAAANGAQVLWLTERIKKDTYKRLEETGMFVFEIMQERDWRNGRNSFKVLKIRLMHAVVRYFTSYYPQWKYEWGLPINQEDMAGTNLAFSYIVVRGLRKMNIKTHSDEEEAYLYFWNIIGFLLGVQKELLPLSLREAFHLDRAIFRRQFQASEAGRGLTKSLIKVLQNQAPTSELQNVPVAQMRFLLGDEVADLLDVPSVPLERILVNTTIYLPFFQVLFRNSSPNSEVLKTYLRR